MIIHKEGDLFTALDNKEIDFAVHCCNAKGKMNSGVAKQVKEKYPAAFTEYQKMLATASRHQVSPLGGISVDYDGGIINLIGQSEYGYDGNRYCHYGHLAAGLSLIGIRGLHTLEDGTKFGFPHKFACDRAGGNWNIVLELIEGVLAVNYDVYIYKLV